MSPSENDLRAALRDGEGDGLEPGRIISRGERLRAKRRSRLLNAAAVTAVIAGIGGGAVLLGKTQGDEQAGSNSNAGGSARVYDSNKDAVQGGAASGGGASAAGGGAPVPGSARSAAAPSAQIGIAGLNGACPDSLPRFVLPPTGGSGPLFSSPVASVVVCTYGSPAEPQKPTRVVLDGADAKVLADSLEQSATHRKMEMCPNYRRADEQAVAFIGLTADGAKAGLVTTVLGRPACATTLLNGKVVRYGWQPPATLTARLGEAGQPTSGVSHGPVVQTTRPGKVQSVAPAK